MLYKFFDKKIGSRVIVTSKAGLNMLAEEFQKPVIKNLKKRWHSRVVITTAQLHSIKPELRLSTGSNPARSVSDIRDDDSGPGWK